MNKLLNEYLSEIELGVPQVKVTNLAEALLLLVDGEADSGCRGRVPNPGQARGLAGWKRTCWLPDEMTTFMKRTKGLFGILTITAALVMNGRSQVYQVSVPINGSMTMSVQDLAGPSGSSGGFTLNFNTLNETIYLDAGAGTIRQVGTISHS